MAYACLNPIQGPPSTLAACCAGLGAWTWMQSLPKTAISDLQTYNLLACQIYGQHWWSLHGAYRYYRQAFSIRELPLISPLLQTGTGMNQLTLASLSCIIPGQFIHSIILVVIFVIFHHSYPSHEHGHPHSFYMMPYRSQVVPNFVGGMRAERDTSLP